jgi:hypothetical protein
MPHVLPSAGYPDHTAESAVLLDVKQEVEHVAVLDHIFLALEINKGSSESRSYKVINIIPSSSYERKTNIIVRMSGFVN